MMPVSGAHKHISVFISHCVENNDEARQYQEVLSSAGFDAFQYGHDLHSGDHIIETLSKRIQECDFFLFIVSDCSIHSDWVQRELGLAVKLREESEGFHPAIIPIYAREGSWRRTHQPPVLFPVRDSKQIGSFLVLIYDRFAVWTNTLTPMLTQTSFLYRR